MESLLLFEHDSVLVHEAKSMKKYMIYQSGVEEHDLNPIQHIRDELERQLGARPWLLNISGQPH